MQSQSTLETDTASAMAGDPEHTNTPYDACCWVVADAAVHLMTLQTLLAAVNVRQIPRAFVSVCVLLQNI
jgi:hypothetical protein